MDFQFIAKRAARGNLVDQQEELKEFAILEQNKNSPIESVSSFESEFQDSSPYLSLDCDSTKKCLDSKSKPFSCSDCNRSFSKKSDFTRHQRSHSGIKEFTCSECKKCFSERYNLLEHQKTHSRTKVFSCPECEKTFVTKRYLVDHRRIHSGVKSFACTVCEKSFTKKFDLTRHQRMHLGLKFVCSVCGSTFSQKSRLVNHQQLHATDPIASQILSVENHFLDIS